ncbi:molybdopterin-binding protein [Actinoplanes sp. Pm04-4]|uniref:Molybdopterin molybdenumtransferase n=1 Tax=Paractinoplanes pyxinae TaxID=2997416 RepID=A0ABT4B994_9ACTN|nr:molybdopterin-binding protein [Actinoplanes pyxinae]MCY1143051.1 molybdopterin-binding protein [Actinoplanes pyxinae]
MQTTSRRPVTGLSWADAHTTARDSAHPLPPEEVSPDAARGRILAAPVHACSPVPAFDAAAMDGYAVAGRGPWTVIGLILAGAESEIDAGNRRSGLRAGFAVEIATGAAVPGGAEAVVPYEDCRRDGVVVTGTRGPRKHIRRAGDDVAVGALIAEAGRVVTATVAAAAVQAGVEVVRVHRRPVVELLVTGDEVVMSGRPGHGQVRDSFTGIVQSVADRAGGAVGISRHLSDDAGHMRTALGAGRGDVLVVSGSSSAGAADHLHSLLDEMGAEWLVRGVACRPGHPQGLAVFPDGRWVVSLPGNPYAGLVAALTLLEPLLAALAGRPSRPLPTASVTGSAKLVPGGTRIAPVRFSGPVAELLPGGGSAGLAAAAGADALAVLPDHWTDGSPAQLLAVP